ncbi:RNase Zc3h12a domain containing protein [Sulfitobacter noctilucicola]|uniref:RNase NYN domain-containing protein n=1 Tax=Sulfitobacter noctilucicola TaxID=1342301 RepID=A0A7W6M5H7_9RHOB|nr:hypothetical protein [Sulfitobacter noctilucicola]KIN63015.1 RNase Zc3h12a domain containing protein [Sulfitobacter noctilucicola]MBB4172458.1 hypothetical protein [Sulfitobacter noctilucicola]
MTPTDILTPIVLILAFVGFVWCLRVYLWVTIALTAVLAIFFAQQFSLDVITPFHWAGFAIVVIFALGAVSFLPERRVKAVKPGNKSGGKGREVVIDGTNVMYWDGEADLNTLKSVVDFFLSRNTIPIVFLDASSRHHLGDKSLNEKGFAKALGLTRDRVMVCPAQTEADAFILKFAKEEGLPIVSNDRFGDRAQQAKGIKLIKGLFVRGKPILEGL